jgi:hypothetical protein
MLHNSDAGVKKSRLQHTACVTPICLNPKIYCSRNCTAMSPVPTAISHRARVKLLRWVERWGTHAISITDNIIIVSIPLICISPIAIMPRRYEKKR